MNLTVMRTLALMELFCSLFVIASIISQIINKNRLGIRKRMISISFFALIWLLSEALAYLLNGPQFDNRVAYFLNLISYVMSNLVLALFMMYCDGCIREKTIISKWIFRIPMIILLINAFVDIIWYSMGRLVIFENGYLTVIGNPPIPVLVSYVLMLFWPPIVAIRRYKEVGMRMVLLLVAFCLPSIISIGVIVFTGYDYSVLLGSATILIVSRSMQNDLKENRLEESLTFTNYFLGTYVSAYYVDLNMHTCKSYKRTEMLDKNYPIFEDFFKSLYLYIDHEVLPEDQKAMLETVHPDNVKKRLMQNPEFSHLFRVVEDNGERTYSMHVIKGADDNHAAFGFNDITDELRKETERQAEAEQIKKVIEGVAASYNVAYVVNMTDDTFTLLRMGESLKEKEGVVNTFSDAKALFLSKIVHPNDREYMGRELEYDRIRQRLEEQSSYSVEYRVLSTKGFSWHEMLITGIDKDEVAMGFAQRDMDITKARLGEQVFEEYFALFVVDIDTGLARAIKNSSKCTIVKEGETADYSELVLKFAQELDEEPKAFFTQLSDIDYVKSELSIDDKRTYTYQSKFEASGNWIDVSSYVISRHEDNTPATFTLGFSYADSLATSRQELLKTVSEQKAMLEQQNGLLEEARNVAENANNSKTRFLFSMSHDIRTPMNAITGFIAMAKKYIDDKDRVLEYLNKIDISGQQLLTLINQVLEMARIESGKIELSEEPVSIPYEFNGIVTVFSELAKRRGLNFEYALENVTHRNVLADRAKMESITMNIVGNAMKYTPEGGTINMLLKEIPCTKEGYGRYLLEVSDTGIGMSEKYIKDLFEPFTRENNSTVSKIQGTGLGMSIVKRLVDLLDGTISVTSKPGEGTRFNVEIDLELTENCSEDSENILTESEISFAGRRVLLVEDNEMNREIARDILESCGFEMEEAADGQSALEMVKSAAQKGDLNYYDLIMMDIQMPKMNGYEATKAIRALPELKSKHIPIIAMTANAFEEDRENALDAGMDAHLTKPIDIPKLLTTLSAFLVNE